MMAVAVTNPFRRLALWIVAVVSPTVFVGPIVPTAVVPSV